MACRHDIRGLGDHVDLDAASRHRSLETLAGCHDKLTSHRHRRRAPSRDDGRKRDLAEIVEPAAGYLDRVVLSIAFAERSYAVHDSSAISGLQALSLLGSIGSLRKRTPVAAKIALVTAGTSA